LIVAKRVGLATRVPFGPFLALGAEIAIFAGSSLLRPFHGV
jgi:prepilin signal peptidase PulO-like enzyme (type II secretory pathway)